jgi:hypothetical protein
MFISLLMKMFAPRKPLTVRRNASDNRVGDQLRFYWRNSGPGFFWNGLFPILTRP